MNITKVSSTSGNILVIDSRLIAERLGIQHDSFIKTIETYKTQAEQAFGIFRFEVEKLDGRGRPSRFYLLMEDQGIYDVLVAFVEPTERKGAKGYNVNPRQIYKSITERYPEVTTICSNLKFPGRGQRETPAIPRTAGVSW